MNKIANVENVVCSAETMSRHPELYHYTKPAAFEGIVGSQTLWCSHYSEMVDHDEIRLMRKLLPPAVAPHMDALMEKNFNRETRRAWNASGRGDQTALDLVNSFYGATFDGNAVRSTPRSKPICFHSRLTRRIRHLIANMASAANGIATQGPRGTALSLTSAMSRKCSKRRVTRDIGLG
jgi:hypothetical protein